MSTDRLAFEESQPLPPPRTAPSVASSSAICERAARLRALVEHPPRHVGEARELGRVGGAARLDDEVEVHERKVVKLRENHLEPVLELEALERRHDEGRLGPARGRRGAEGRVGRLARATGPARPRVRTAQRRPPARSGRGRAGGGGAGGGGDEAQPASDASARARERSDDARRARALTSSPPFP